MTLQEIDEKRITVTKTLNQSKRSQLGQFLTPIQIASFMASWFENLTGTITLLDPGAGIGSLSAAFLTRITKVIDPPTSITVTAYEIDSSLIHSLEDTLTSIGNLITTRGINFTSEVINEDFILKTAQSDSITLFNPQAASTTFTHAILNPPYKKINSSSLHRLALRELNIETSNLYSGFLAATILLMKKHGEIVAIVPRSFCNGTYFLPFREYLLANTAIRRIHLFNSRHEAFNDDDVLQENIIIHLVKGEKQGQVIISNSTDSKFNDLSHFVAEFNSIVYEGDSNLYMHIPEQRDLNLKSINGITYTLKNLGVEISTGPVVDFRLKEHLVKDLEEGAVPLLYSNHFGLKEIIFPVESKKPNAIRLNKETLKWLTQRGYYTVTKRFSSKEENQRIVARVISPDNFSYDIFGIENHLNYFNVKKRSLDPILAYGLAAYLNSSIVDKYFRLFSGHTQVNATDLKQLVYPSLTVLNQLGEWVLTQDSFVPNDIDRKLLEILED